MQHTSDVEGKVGVTEGSGGTQAVSSRSAEELPRRLRLIKEREEVEEEKIRIRAQAEQDEKRLGARSEQLELELQLAEMGQYDEAEVEPLRIRSKPATETESAPASILSSHVKRVLLPPTELRPFTGEVEDYHLFMRAFETRIMKKKTDDSSELLFYLDQFTKGNPNQLVRSCLHLREGGFDEARRLLEVRYGDPIYFLDSYAKRVKGWPRVPTGDVDALDRFVMFLTEVKNAMSAVHLGEFEHPTTMRFIMSKMLSYLQDRWLREADRLTQQGRTIRFGNLVEFLTVEVRVKRSPLFGVRPGEGGMATEAPRVSLSRHNVNTARVSDTRSDQRCLH